MPETEGIIKFTYDNRLRSPVLPPDYLEGLAEEVEKVRVPLRVFDLLGEDKGGVGFGNLSVRLKGKCFIITTSGTSGREFLAPDCFSLIDGYSFEENTVSSVGLLPPSSESLTHAALYDLEMPHPTRSQIDAVVHIHSISMWERYIDKLPTTRRSVEYGTPEMALEIQKVVKEWWKLLMVIPVIVMAGHEGGLLSFGTTLHEHILVPSACFL